MANTKKYILALDQGTTSSRALLFDHDGKEVAKTQKEFTQIFPQDGWVEHDPMEIWSSQEEVMNHIFNDDLTPDMVAGIGITNQRETTIIWNKNTGLPIYNAIVWQDRRTAQYCQKLKADGFTDMIRTKTGLLADAYFSGTKIKWILDNVEGAREQAKEGDLYFGTVDTWLIYNLTGKKEHVTDVTNASRTMLFNINTMDWDDELLKLLDIPKNLLPKVLMCTDIYGHAEVNGRSIPICGVAGDQQAALFGQMCLKPGESKNTYGTGCFMMVNTGDEIVTSKHQLLSTVAWQIKGHKPNYAMEGSVFIGGAVIQWLRDGLQIIDDAKSTSEIASSVEDNGGVYFVPALTGLGAPHWDQYARGMIIGISRATSQAHIVRAALESIAFQVNDLLKAMEKDLGKPITILKVDGGAVANDLLMQEQAEISNLKISRPETLETTALGAAFFAGLSCGFWPNLDSIQHIWQENKSFTPKNHSKYIPMIGKWHEAVSRSLKWINEYHG